MKNAVFWDFTPCGSCKNRRLRETFRLHHQGERIDELGTKLGVTSNWSKQRIMNVACSIFLSWRWKGYFLQKQHVLQEPHGVRTQKNEIFVVSAVKASIPIRNFIRICYAFRQQQILPAPLFLYLPHSNLLHISSKFLSTTFISQLECEEHFAKCIHRGVKPFGFQLRRLAKLFQRHACHFHS
jgi:hypothetical protein